MINPNSPEVLAAREAKAALDAAIARVSHSGVEPLVEIPPATFYPEPYSTAEAGETWPNSWLSPTERKGR